MDLLCQEKPWAEFDVNDLKPVISVENYNSKKLTSIIMTLIPS